MDIILQWKDPRGMQVGIHIDNERDGYHLTVGAYSGMQVDIDIGNESDGCRNTVGGCSGDTGRY